MAAKGQKKLLALDTNFLLDLARKELFAEDFRDFFRRLGFQLLIPPTVVAEIAVASEDDSDEKRVLALKVSRNLIRWGLQPFPVNSAGEFIAERFSARLREKGLLPFDEINDGIILAETSLGGISILVTRDKHLLGIDETSLSMAFNDADLAPVNPAHPRRLLRSAQQMF
ncbi:MAG TPA: type II toxin-antitoxin system VapC family toxin [Verrucomicrobiae bacterium]|jgi:predicted nucleic acid-binding protein|nr:type II toxin-antitoxin system VapC family toxin [Verrucomicrobiae bacterium]